MAEKWNPVVLNTLNFCHRYLVRLSQVIIYNKNYSTYIATLEATLLTPSYKQKNVSSFYF